MILIKRNFIFSENLFINKQQDQRDQICRFFPIWRNLKAFGNFLRLTRLVFGNIWTYFGNFYVDWANFRCCKNGHTGSDALSVAATGFLHQTGFMKLDKSFFKDETSEATFLDD